MGKKVDQGHAGQQMVCVLAKVVRQPWNDLVWGTGMVHSVGKGEERGIKAVDEAGVAHGDRAGRSSRKVKRRSLMD